ncbi:MAG: hypothetical protein AB1668_05365, partial [Nanoarchaeota archaeon]
INKPNRSSPVTSFVSCLLATAAGFVGLVLDFIITAELWGLIPKTRIKMSKLGSYSIKNWLSTLPSTFLLAFLQTCQKNKKSQ